MKTLLGDTRALQRMSSADIRLQLDRAGFLIAHGRVTADQLDHLQALVKEGMQILEERERQCSQS